MKRSMSASLLLATLLASLAGPAEAKVVEGRRVAQPGEGRNQRPTLAGTRNRRTAGGLSQRERVRTPGVGTLPPGSWVAQCCPSRTAAPPAWHYRSFGIVPPGAYRFGAVARMRGTFLSSVAIGSTSDGVWIRVT